jgi:hypothetical protein
MRRFVDERTQCLRIIEASIEKLVEERIQCVGMHLGISFGIIEACTERFWLKQNLPVDSY